MDKMLQTLVMRVVSLLTFRFLPQVSGFIIDGLCSTMFCCSLEPCVNSADVSLHVICGIAVLSAFVGDTFSKSGCLGDVLTRHCPPGTTQDNREGLELLKTAIAKAGYTDKVT